MKSGGAVTNGSAQDDAATIQGRGGGVSMVSGVGSVANFGTITSSAGAGIFLGGGGDVTNGSAKDLTAYIRGYADGVQAFGSGKVANFGTISANGAAGVYFSAAGKVTNGSNGDTTALIAGYHGVEFAQGYSTVANFGTITGYVQSAVLLAYGGLVTNGGKRDIGALIQGASNGVSSRGPAASVINFGTILGGVSNLDAGVYLNGGSVTNGTTKDTTALIAGVMGVRTDDTPDITVTNFGTIEGTGGIAVQFLASSDVLVVEAGSAFVGEILGDGGTLDLASGIGTLAGVLASGAVTVSGSMATTTFTGFGTLEIGAGADFNQTGATTIASGQAVIDAGTLSLGSKGAGSIVNAGLIETTGAGTLTLASAVNNTGTIAVNGGTVTVSGAVTNAGVATIDGGTLDLASTFSENVTFTGTAGALELAKSRSYIGTIGGFSITGGTSLDLADIGFVSPGEAAFSGTRTKGVLTVTDGTHTAKIRLTGDYLGATFTASSDGHGGTDIVATTGALAQTAHCFIAAASGLGGGAGGSASVIHESRREHPPMLARPGTMTA